MIPARRLAFSIFVGLAAASPLAAQDAPATADGLSAGQVDPGGGQTLTITGEPLQSDAERRDEAARYFGSHAVPTRIGQFARWNHRVCVRTWGLPLALNAQVSIRVMDVMDRLGIPTNRAALCRPNVRIGFTAAPQMMIERAVARNRMIIGFHYASQRRQITRIRQPVQAWYATTTIGAAGIEVLDDAADLAPSGRAYSRLSADMSSGLEHVLVLADSRILAGEEVGPVAELLAFYALAPTRGADVCDEAVTILNLTNPACPPARRPTELTRQDLAYLHAIYRTNPALGPRQQRGAIVGNMANQLE